MLKKIDAVRALRPNAGFAFSEDKIIWVDQNYTEPTEEEINNYIIDNQDRLDKLVRDSVWKAMELPIKRRLDTFSRTKGYDNIGSAIAYATSNIPSFRDEGLAAIHARDITWSAFLDIINSVEDGKRIMPKEYSEIEEFLPILEW